MSHPSGKVAPITGGTSGIGLAAAEASLGARARVALGAQNPDSAAGPVGRLRGLGDLLAGRADVSPEAQERATTWPAIVCLASDEACWITGGVLAADGGLTAD